MPANDPTWRPDPRMIYPISYAHRALKNLRQPINLLEEIALRYILIEAAGEFYWETNSMNELINKLTELAKDVLKDYRQNPLEPLVTISKYRQRY